MTRTPNWQPISQMPLIAQMIDGELKQSQKQYQNLQPALSSPHVLDNATVERLIKVFGERQEFLGIYTKQLARWKALDLNAPQKREVDRLEQQLEKLVKVNAQIVTLANQLKEGTIEKVLGKSDLELGLEAFKRQRFNQA
jgi:acetolactate synthase regulatory subunit